MRMLNGYRRTINIHDDDDNDDDGRGNIFRRGSDSNKTRFKGPINRSINQSIFA